MRGCDSAHRELGWMFVNVIKLVVVVLIVVVIATAVTGEPLNRLLRDGAHGPLLELFHRRLEVRLRFLLVERNVRALRVLRPYLAVRGDERLEVSGNSLVLRELLWHWLLRAVKLLQLNCLTLEQLNEWR